MSGYTILEEQDATFQDCPPDESFEKWRVIDVTKLATEQEKLVAYRLNALGSFYFFCKSILKKHRFVDHLHKPLAEEIESFHVQKVIEVPRDHFKTTIFSEGGSMWWALPFTDVDEAYMRSLGYSDNFIRWMKRAHDPDTNTLIISEVVDNCIKFGIRIDSHYMQNQLFRHLFQEILPDETCKWTEKSKTHKRSKESAQGEGTYDFLGVGGALQSRHYKRMIEDDLVGKKALKSETVMKDTIQYHQLLPGGFDSSEDDKEVGNDEIIVGNRWSEKDLNQHIRDEEQYFQIINHSAEGGCCALHPPNKIVFPEEFTWTKLGRWKKRLGSYLYSCQFLNDPVAPGATRWNENLLRYYTYGLGTEKYDKDGNKYRPVKIVHEMVNGQQLPDIWPRQLIISMVVDPRHSDNSTGRCNHAIGVYGLDKPTSRLYLLDCYAELGSYTDLCEQIREWVQKWNLRKIWLETIAAQKYLKFYLDEANSRLDYSKRFKVEELKTDKTENGKAIRIESMDPFYENNLFYVNRAEKKFPNEFRKYPVGKFKDILDITGYVQQTWQEVANAADVKSFMQRANQNNPFAPSSTISSTLNVPTYSGRSEITGY